MSPEEKNCLNYLWESEQIRLLYGVYHFVPKDTVGWSAQILRIIADSIDRANTALANDEEKE